MEFAYELGMQPEMVWQSDEVATVVLKFNVAMQVQNAVCSADTSLYSVLLHQENPWEQFQCETN